MSTKKRKITKKHIAVLHKRAHALMAELGATRTSEADPVKWTRDEWVLVTVHGRVAITLSERSLFTRFIDSPKAARAAGIDCNQYTGKYNFHYFNASEYESETLLADAEWHFKRILPPRDFSDDAA